MLRLPLYLPGRKGGTGSDNLRLSAASISLLPGSFTGGGSGARGSRGAMMMFGRGVIGPGFQPILPIVLSLGAAGGRSIRGCRSDQKSKPRENPRRVQEKRKRMRPTIPLPSKRGVRES